MTSNTLRFTAALLGSLALPAAATAQLNASDYFFIEGDELWAGTPPMTSTGVAWGNLTDDGVPDGLIIRDDVPYLLYGTVGYRRVQALPVDPGETVSDMAVYPQVNTDLSDALLTGGSGGVVEWRWNASNNDFDRTTIEAGWGAIERVMISRYSVTYDVVVAVDTQGVAHSMLFNPTTGAKLFNFWNTNLGSDAGQTALLDIDGDIAAELAVVTDYGLEIQELNGTTIVNVPRPTAGLGDDHTTDVLTTLTGDSASLDRVAWILNPTSADSQLILADATGLETQIALPGYRPVDAAVGDIDGDGLTDLAASLEDSGLVLSLLQDASSNAFDLGNAFDMGGSGSGLATSGIALGDLNNDGDLDVLIANDGAAGFRLFGGSEVDAADLVIDVDAPAANVYLPFGIHAYLLELPLLGPNIVPADANKFRVTTWTGDDSTSTQAIGPVDVKYDPMPASFPSTDLVTSASVPSHDIYRFMEIRMVRDVPGLPLKAYPPHFMFVGLTQPESDLFYSGYQALTLDPGDMKAGSEVPDQADKAPTPGVTPRLPDIPL